MKFHKLFIIASIILLITVLSNLTSASEEINEKVFLTERAIYPLPIGVSQIRPSYLMIRSREIEQKAKSLIISPEAIKTFGFAEKVFLRNLLLGESNQAIFAMGYDLKPNFLQGFLEIKTKSSVDIVSGAEARIFANGLYNIGQNHGPFLSVDIVSEERPSAQVLLENVNKEIDKIINAKKPAPSFWIIKNNYRRNIIKSPFGNYNQCLTVKKLMDDNSTHFDYWLVLIINESVSGITAYKSNYVNRKNDTKIDIKHHTQELITYGPGGDVSPENTVSFSLGITGPTLGVSWGTGKTSLKNISDMSKKYCRWQVNYNTWGDEAKGSYAWKPGLEIRNKEASSLIIKVENNAEWEHQYAMGMVDKIFPNKYELTVLP